MGSYALIVECVLLHWTGLSGPAAKPGEGRVGEQQPQIDRSRHKPVRAVRRVCTPGACLCPFGGDGGMLTFLYAPSVCPCDRLASGVGKWRRRQTAVLRNVREEREAGL